MHTLKIDVFGDIEASKGFSNLPDLMQNYVACASVIYAGQMQVELQIKRQQIWSSNKGAPTFAKGCNGGKYSREFMINKLYGLAYYTIDNKLNNGVPDTAATHLFTDCGNGFGIIGVAFLGVLCSTEGVNVGVNQMTNDDTGSAETWVTFAHELGHNFNAEHSFEEGQGVTGGIMDYDNGTLDGKYQFNKQYRQAEMCGELTLAKNSVAAASATKACTDNFGPVP